MTRALLSLIDSKLAAMLLALDERDAQTGRHADRVMVWCLLVGRDRGLSDGDLHVLGVAAGLHDLGKIGLPDRILGKRGAFEGDERQIMQTHAVTGERLVLATAMPESARIARVVRAHHERVDGTGYPDGLRGEAIPIAARIIAVVDTWDAMTSQRTYRPVRTRRESLDELRRVQGSQHDRGISEHVMRLLDRRESLESLE